VRARHWLIALMVSLVLLPEDGYDLATVPDDSFKTGRTWETPGGRVSPGCASTVTRGC
jgi:8-oxo-dGTP pyrophosphatase MutT (NUDIX family)